MPLFDFYIMVDWSGAARRRGRRSDCIWIAHGRTEADEPVTDSPFSRTEAIRLIRSILLKEIASGHRVYGSHFDTISTSLATVFMLRAVPISDCNTAEEMVHTAGEIRLIG
jgi:hypothetical protein